jgi:hypothetical protein
VIPDESIDFYKEAGLLEKMDLQKEYAIQATVLVAQNELTKNNLNSLINLPLKQDISIHGRIYLLKK